MLKIREVLILFIALTIIVFAITACGRKGSLNQNQLPVIEITSYEGLDSLAAAQTEEAYSFQKKIYWEAHDVDGIVEKYAFRVLKEDLQPYTDSDGNPVGVPGYSAVDEDGWVYHYMPGADESIPLELSDQRWIWTEQVYAVINFPANVDGDSSQVVSVFEVKCIDDIGDESAEPARRYFKAKSNVPECNITSSKGDINGETIGTGIVFKFAILDSDQFIQNIPNYFEFKFEKRNLLGELIPENEGGYNDVWWSTKNKQDVTSYFISLDDAEGSQPAMKLNSIENGVVQDSTYLIAKAVDLAGIISLPDTVSFVVKEGFYPNTLIYNGIKQSGINNKNDIIALGTNHYLTHNPRMKIIPSVLTTSGTRYAAPFWVDRNGDYTCIHSNDLKIYMHWGYRGEFTDNNPDDKFVGKVYDELTSKQYFSEIKYFDLRLDGQPYYYAPLPAAQYNYVDESTGKEWLRVPVASTISQKATLSGLSPGTHRFEVRAVDMQNEPDRTPSEFVFKIVEFVPASQKEGILVLDNTLDNNYTPPAIIDTLYSKQGYFKNYPHVVDRLERSWLAENVWVDRNYTKDIFSPTDLQNYKTVVYHAENLESMKFALEYNTMELYLQSGGNIILSGNANLSIEMQRDMKNNNYPILEKNFGIDYLQDDAISYPTDSYSPLSPNIFFVGADGSSSEYPEIDLKLPSFNPTVTTAFGPIAYFPVQYLNSATTEVLYTFRCKQPGDDPTDPSNAEYDYYSAQPVAVKNTTANNKCYIFGFPLSYMDDDAVSEMLMYIIQNEIEQ